MTALCRGSAGDPLWKRSLKAVALDLSVLSSVSTPAGANAKSELLGRFDPVLSRAEWVPPRYVLATFAGDSVFLIDSETGKTSIVFHPGNDVQSAIGDKGHIAFFVKNGLKVYVGKTE